MRQLTKQFGKIKVSVPIPHLLTLQIDSYRKFLQEGVPTEKRDKEVGLESVFRTVFPIEDFNGTSSLEFVKYEIQEPKYDIPECITKGLTYEAPLRIHVRLVLYDVDEASGTKTPRDIKEQDIYFGTIPLMTEKGTFIVNGTERVIVNQLQRSPGIIFEHDDGKTHSSHKLLYSCRVIPMRGSWLDFDFDHKDILYVRIDRRRKMPATILFKAMGMSQQDILDYFYRTETYELSTDGRLFWKVQADLFRKEPAYADIVTDEGKVIVQQGKEITKGKWNQIIRNGIGRIEVNPDAIIGMFLAKDLTDPNTGELIAAGGDEISEPLRDYIVESGFTELTVLHTQGTDTSSSIRDTLMLDHTEDMEKAQEEIYRRLRPSSPPTPEIAASFFDNLFRNEMYYDLSLVGRYKLMQRLGLADEIIEKSRELALRLREELQDVDGNDTELVRRAREFVTDFVNGKKLDSSLYNSFMNIAAEAKLEDFFREEKKSTDEKTVTVATLSDEIRKNAQEFEKLAKTRTLRDEDIRIAIRYLVELKDSHGAADDIDHLGNRRVRLVGELVENQYRVGLVRMERAIKERMNVQESSQLMPHDLINPKPVGAVLKEFFGTSQLSQFMDQTNALSEVTHKRRLSALGPGGLTRERAGFEVRDVHTSHYGRICPIETPEGPNIGLIVSLTTFARVNDFGFIETPYRVVRDCHVTDEICTQDASSESADQVVAQADVRIDNDGNLVDEFVTVRVKGEVETRRKSEVTLMDISPSQMVSISAALIPFLEHDDANRALMGSNMQRQAVPLLRSEKPLVGTGMEVDVARDSGACIVAVADGKIQYVDADRIVVSYEGDAFAEQGGVKAYDLLKFHKSNQNTCFGQKPTCYPGQRVTKGQILADGPGIDEGVLALGKNLVVAFMPWCGYNYEDSILISERAVKDDIFTSIHIEEFEVVARDTKLGPEEITCDIPNVGDDMLRNLDESGIIRIGAAVKPEDILVGKITPKGETQLTPEEKLLRAIFGEKARDVKNTSLKVPPGVEGTVIDVKVFNRRSSGEKDKDQRTLEIENLERERLDRKEEEHLQALGRRTKELIWPVIRGKQVNVTVTGRKRGEVLVEAGGVFEQEQLEDVPVKKLAGIFRSHETNDAVAAIIDDYDRQTAFISGIYDNKRGKISEGDDLAPGVIKMVKVHVAIKRKLSVGDKMAGRHGNKGVVSCILPEEDMPFFEDGRPVDIVLNPLGVPSRMNIGQIMETHLGWGAKELGRMLATLIDSGKALEVVRNEVKDIFASEEISALVDDMDDEEFVESVRRLRPGIVTRTPVFDSATEDEIWGWMEKAHLDNDGKTQLYDGRTGQPFENRVTTGVMYMLKLHHLVDEKIHARSTGPYSLVTQQPLGGKAQFGGQRLGEMEVWALEAYGAAYLLQEFLTVKSDDVTGRVKMYEKIVKGDNFLEAGLPESFNVLVQELKSLALNVTLHEEKEKKNPRRIGIAPENM